MKCTLGRFLPGLSGGKYQRVGLHRGTCFHNHAWVNALLRTMHACDARYYCASAWMWDLLASIAALRWSTRAYTSICIPSVSVRMVGCCSPCGDVAPLMYHWRSLLTPPFSCFAHLATLASSQSVTATHSGSKWPRTRSLFVLRSCTVSLIGGPWLQLSWWDDPLMGLSSHVEFISEGHRPVAASQCAPISVPPLCPPLWLGELVAIMRPASHQALLSARHKPVGDGFSDTTKKRRWR